MFSFKQIKQHKKRVNYTINKHTIDRFKVVADKDMRKMSNIVENLIRRYVDNHLLEIHNKLFRKMKFNELIF